MSELGVIADLLESGGEPGLAAAVRVLEYCEAQGIGVDDWTADDVRLVPLTVRACERLFELGHPELADSLNQIHGDICCYGHSLPDRPRGHVPMYAPAGGGMREFRRGDDPSDVYFRESRLPTPSAPHIISDPRQDPPTFVWSNP